MRMSCIFYNKLTYLSYLLTYYNQVGLYTGMLVLWDYLA